MPACEETDRLERPKACVVGGVTALYLETSRIAESVCAAHGNCFLLQCSCIRSKVSQGTARHGTALDDEMNQQHTLFAKVVLCMQGLLPTFSADGHLVESSRAHARSSSLLSQCPMQDWEVVTCMRHDCRLDFTHVHSVALPSSLGPNKEMPLNSCPCSCRGHSRKCSTLAFTSVWASAILRRRPNSWN